MSGDRVILGYSKVTSVKKDGTIRNYRDSALKHGQG